MKILAHYQTNPTLKEIVDGIHSIESLMERVASDDLPKLEINHTITQEDVINEYLTVESMLEDIRRNPYVTKQQVIDMQTKLGVVFMDQHHSLEDLSDMPSCTHSIYIEEFLGGVSKTVLAAGAIILVAVVAIVGVVIWLKKRGEADSGYSSSLAKAEETVIAKAKRILADLKANHASGDANRLANLLESAIKEAETATSKQDASGITEANTKMASLLMEIGNKVYNKNDAASNLDGVEHPVGDSTAEDSKKVVEIKDIATGIAKGMETFNSNDPLGLKTLQQYQGELKKLKMSLTRLQKEAIHNGSYNEKLKKEEVDKYAADPELKWLLNGFQNGPSEKKQAELETSKKIIRQTYGLVAQRLNVALSDGEDYARELITKLNVAITQVKDLSAVAMFEFLDNETEKYMRTRVSRVETTYKRDSEKNIAAMQAIKTELEDISKVCGEMASAAKSFNSLNDEKKEAVEPLHKLAHDIKSAVTYLDKYIKEHIIVSRDRLGLMFACQNFSKETGKKVIKLTNEYLDYLNKVSNLLSNDKQKERAAEKAKEQSGQAKPEAKPAEPKAKPDDPLPV